jgi:hypothetical protein
LGIAATVDFGERLATSVKLQDQTTAVNDKRALRAVFIAASLWWYVICTQSGENR